MIYLFLAPGFEEIEAITTLDILRRAELPVSTVGVQGKEVEGAHGIVVRADLAEEQAAEEGLEMVVLPGGVPGTPNLEKSAAVKRCVEYCLQKGRLVGAICAAPSILGHMGALQGKKATCFPGYEAELAGAQVKNRAVCVDGNIVTARGAGAAIEFGLQLVACMKGEQFAKQLGEKMQWR